MSTTDSCPVCEAELATVTLRTSEGQTRVGPKCSRILEQLIRLFGVEPKRWRDGVRVVG